ncbi:MAG: hypothetical protein K6L73_05930 [Cellvibrionaceae bacterium]
MSELSLLSVSQLQAPQTNLNVFVLDDYALVSVTGPDAEKFLQGQVTCDIRQLAEGAALLGAHCNHKGRAIISFRAARTADETLMLRLHKSLLETALQALSKYVVFSKAELSDASEDYQLLGFSGEGATAQITEWFGTTPEVNQSLTNELGTVTCVSPQRYECWLKKEHSLKANTQACSGWQLLDIETGIGEVRAETREEFIPQFLNFDRLEGISFNKGCYTGQEVVARMHYLGKQKRRMYRFAVEGISGTTENVEVPTPGTPLMDNGKNVGDVVSAAINPNNNKIELLAVINGEDKSPALGEQPLTQLPLPYSITAEAE